jgi:protein-tyrosine phosphatase
MARNAGRADALIINSAGTFEGRAGQPASRLAIEAAERRGYDLSAHRARALAREDIERFDYLLAMDRTHLAVLRAMAPRGHREKPRLFMTYAPAARVIDVADPFGGGLSDYERALDLIETGCTGLLDDLKARDLF